MRSTSGRRCCLVHNADIDGERYLLSCLHVFPARMRRPPPGGIDCVADDARAIGPLDDAASPTGPAAVDAALVRIDDATVSDVSIWGLTPTRRATDFDIDELPGRGQLFVLGRLVAPAVGNLPAEVRKQPVPAFFRQIIPNPAPYDYTAAAGRVFDFADTIEYRANTRPGDSGAALVDTTGMIYGMHFFGRGEFGYAMAAPRLFDPGVFTVEIAL